MIPHWKIKVGGVDLTDDFLSATVVRPINAIDYATLIVNDYKGKNFIANIDLFDTIDIYMDWVDATTLIHSGVIEEVGPDLSVQSGETLKVKSRGLGRALLLTHCNTSYGIEGNKPGGITLEDPDEIWTDLVTNYVNKSFGGATTYNIGTNINIRPTPNINYLNGAFRNNFDLINEVLQLRQADEGPSTASDQFFVDAAGTLHIKAVDESHGVAPLGWTHYWESAVTAPTITEGATIIFSSFSRTAQDFANKIIYCGQLRKPAFDTWTEDGGPVWGEYNCNADYSSANKMVGSHSLLIEPDGVGSSAAYYPSTHDAAWDFTKIGSSQSIPHLCFYIRFNDPALISSNNLIVRLVKNDALIFGDATSDDYYAHIRDFVQAIEDQWYYVELPIGPYYTADPSLKRTTSGGTEYYWKWNELVGGTLDWSEINAIQFLAGNITTHDVYIDDLHFTGKIIRCAYNNTNIGVNNEVQKVIIDDTAHDDTMTEGTPGVTDIGTCAMLAKGELMRCQRTPIVGIVTFGVGTETLLPGQVFHLHGRHVTGGTYRIDGDYRVTKVTHNFSKDGFTSTVEVTSDVLNSFPKTVPELASIITKYSLLGHKEAKNLKAAGIDILVPILSEVYNSAVINP